MSSINDEFLPYCFNCCKCIGGQVPGKMITIKSKVDSDHCFTVLNGFALKFIG